MSGLKLIQPRLNYNFPLKNKIFALKSLLFSANYKRFTILKKYFKSEKILFFNSGHSALQFFLTQLPANTCVGVQPFTCPTVLESIINAKCKIVFIDINNQLIIDESSLKNKINDFDVIILTHTFGNPVDIKSLIPIIENKIIIEDCAHAFLTKYNNVIVGKTGDVSIFSHGFAKFPTVFNGGYLLFNNENLYNELKSQYETLPFPKLIESLKILLQSIILNISNNPFIYTVFTKKIKQKKQGIFVYKYISENKVKKEYRFSQTLLDIELQKIENYLFIQRNNGKRITNALQQNPSFVVNHFNSEINFFMLPAFVKNPSKFIEFAKQNGIEIGQHFVQSRKVINHFGYVSGDCENYERVINELITFPTHYNYPIKKIDQIIQLIIDFKE